MHKRNMVLAIVVISALIAVTAGWWYWRHIEIYPDTDNAYIGANVVNIATQVSGRVSKVYVHENDMVQKGQVLFELDSQQFQIALQKAEAKLAAVKQQRDSDEAGLQIAQAGLAKARVEVESEERKSLRARRLVEMRYISLEAADHALVNVKTAIAAHSQAQALERQARVNLGGSLSDDIPKIREAQADLDQARLNLAYSSVQAPAAGYVSKFSLRPGDMVEARSPLFSVIDTSEWWVDANFKETNIVRIRPGQEATINVDNYPGVTFRGVVQSISSGSGAVFSLFPPENASGNWVKITQRVPVRVHILNLDGHYPLRIGTSAIVTINTNMSAQPPINH